MNPIHEAWKATLRALRPSPPPAPKPLARAETPGPHAACAGQARARVTLVSRWKERMKMKVVIITCYGGFSLSEKAVMRYAELKGLTVYPEHSTPSPTYWLVPEGEREDQTNFYTWSLDERKASNARLLNQVLNERDISRADPALVQVVEELGAGANGRFADLAVVEIPDGVAWQIEEYDGYEHVAEKHRTWGAGL